MTPEPAIGAAAGERDTVAPAARTLLIAHRGAPRERPENTLPSFLRALELGAHGIELDVHRSSDGVLVVHHDEVPRAIAPSGRLAGRRIDSLTFDELQGFAVGGSALIPTLDEVLAVVKGRARLFIELKGTGTEEGVVQAVRDSAAPEQCAVHSFGHEAVRRVHEMAPEIRCGILFDRAPVDVAASMRESGAVDVWPQWALVDQALVDAVHTAGGRVIPWTVNRAEAARALVALGADAICTDVLPEIREALENRA
ncbi:MAG TPA: glycerophosphodiester phosphodiesterase [Gemmatimonadaceae bacterium]|nr:glycerophosphodiester phosphodiesterase [Gemmatimonadaceae bacterium]